MTSEYHSWYNAKRRCHNPEDKQYPDYGGRGIGMVKEWRESLDQFLEDMGPCPEGYTLDRIDNSLGYSPDNCRWADKNTQNNNTRSNKIVASTDGTKTDTVANWIKTSNVPEGTARARLGKLGWTVEQALEQEPPPHRNRNNKMARQPLPYEKMKLFFTYNGVTKALKAWCRETGETSANVRNRINKLGWTVGQALGFEPPPPLKHPQRERRIAYNGVEKTLNEWSKETGIKKHNILNRLDKYKWSVGEALEFEERKG